jgi:hypothetical protein
MGTLTRPILMGGIRTSELNLVSKICERLSNFMTLAEFTTTIHANIFVETIRGIVGEPEV